MVHPSFLWTGLNDILRVPLYLANQTKPRDVQLPRSRNRGRDHGNGYFFQQSRKWAKKKRKFCANSDLLVGSTAMYLLSLESSLKMGENGAYFVMISSKFCELFKFEF